MKEKLKNEEDKNGFHWVGWEVTFRMFNPNSSSWYGLIPPQ